ncbi:hypothetical protein [Dyadobacter psychrophilus]|uniref:Uncharacterized protein n=1 Tax=Dyadobacter psychrophilus TaxID=651661 RepID=A0A1T5GYK9_9BACT|nr:hypothetical protein [Dyadobacter psychrophilus]SKC13461.1 hypothetical protein SAMN05660293_04586 [Dyadobacter psychrophilus]
MNKFTSVEEAFEWWLANIYQTLPADTKEGRYRNAWRDYTFKKGISQKRMKEILSDFGDIDEKTVITFKLR